MPANKAEMQIRAASPEHIEQVRAQGWAYLHVNADGPNRHERQRMFALMRSKRKEGGNRKRARSH